MTITLEVKDSAKKQVLWMLRHFKGDLTISTNEPIENTSIEESNEILEKLSSIPKKDKDIDNSASIEFSL